MRLAAFLFGVVPQVIKIFSARGIPITQALAATLFLSTVASMARTMNLADGQKDITNFMQERLGSPSAGSRAKERLKAVVSLVGVVPQLVALRYVWAAIASHAGVELRSKNVVNGAGLIGELSFTLSFFYHVQDLICCVVWKRRFLPRPFWLTAAMITNTYNLPRLLTNEYTQSIQLRLERDLWLPLYFYAALFSYFVAFSLERVASMILSRSEEQPEEGRGVEQSDTALMPQLYANASTAHDNEDGNGGDLGDNRASALMITTDDALVGQQRGYHPATPQSLHSTQPPDPTTTPEEATTNQDETSGTDRLPFWMYIILYPAFAVLLIIWYGKIFKLPVHHDELEEAEEGATTQHPQITAEVPQPQAAQSREGSKFWCWLLKPLVLVNEGLRVVVHYLCMICLTWYGQFINPFMWVYSKLENKIQDTVWVAFGILNVATGAIYYLLIFDGEGTYMPEWSSFLG